MNFNAEYEHVEEFINGFESIISQYRDNGIVNISGTESYTVGVLRANNLPLTPVSGFENFITKGLSKLWEMIKNFFSGIREFFSGNKKRKVEEAKNNINKSFKITVKEPKLDNKLSITMNKSIKDMTTIVNKIEKIKKGGVVVYFMPKLEFKREINYKKISNLAWYNNIERHIEDIEKIVNDFLRINGFKYEDASVLEGKKSLEISTIEKINDFNKALVVFRDKLNKHLDDALKFELEVERIVSSGYKGEDSDELNNESKEFFKHYGNFVKQLGSIVSSTDTYILNASDNKAKLEQYLKNYSKEV